MLLEVDTSNPSILEVDLFGLLVSLTYSLPSLFHENSAAPLPSSNVQVHLVFIFFYLRISILLLGIKIHEANVILPRY